MYTGVQAIDRRLLSKMPPAGSVFSITRDTYTSVLEEGAYLNSICYEGYFSDVGTIERLEEARKSY